MCERARRSRDSSSHYSIDTLLPGLCTSTTSSNNNNSTMTQSSTSTTSSPTRIGSHSLHFAVAKPTNDASMDQNPTMVENPPCKLIMLKVIKGLPSLVNQSSPGSIESKIPDKSHHHHKSANSGKKKSSLSTAARISSSKSRSTTPAQNPSPTLPAQTTGQKLQTKQAMFDIFQPWVLHTYGDSAKTKTITMKKCLRIIKTLRGEEINNAENSKFRFWVKSKGFVVSLPAGCQRTGYGLESQNRDEDKIQKYVQLQPDLFVPTAVKDDTDGGMDKRVFKRVAVVEHFFDIIYTVHTETEAKNGKHAGQKRTYRAITEKYAFLPREAVTKFLLQCVDCSKRASPTVCDPSSPPKQRKISPTLNGKLFSTKLAKKISQNPELHTNSSGDKPFEQKHRVKKSNLNPENSRQHHHRPTHPVPLDIKFCLPFTTTYLRQQQMRIQAEQLIHSNGLTTDVDENRIKEELLDKNEKDDDDDHMMILVDDDDFKDDDGQMQVNNFKEEADDDEKTLLVTSKEAESHNHRKRTHKSSSGRMVKMSGSSGRKRLAPTKVTKVKGGRGGAAAASSVGMLDDYLLSKDSGNSGQMSGSDRSSVDENHDHEVKGHSKHSKIMKESTSIISDGPITTTPVEWIGYHPIGFSKKEIINNNNHSSSVFTNGKHEARKQSSPLSLSERSGGGSLSREMTTGQDENSSNGNKDDEDDDDDDSLDKVDTHQHDPERLKSFNMFVRLFVDENLDRMVPISKQPKEKIQAIIDSCTRQFPEYAERARKRIRTYLKSCRRNKRIKECGANGGGGPGGAGWESTRPTPAHLTSAQAEQILAQACENESQNAKRMRMGLEPVSQPHPLNNNNNTNGTSARFLNDLSGNGYSKDANDKQISHSPRSSNSTPSPEKIMKLSNSSSSTMPSPCTTAATISAVVAAAVAASANSTCSGLSSPSSAISSSAFSDVMNPSANLSNNGANLSLLNNQASNGSHHHLNGSASPPILSLLDSPQLSNTSNMSGLSKLVGAERNNQVVDYSRRLNGTTNGLTGVSMYKPNFCQSLTKPTQFPSVFPSPSGANCGIFCLSASMPPVVANGDAGPTDLSMKSKPLLTQQLNVTELATVRQLIMGYRESAAFLLRSADELEQLLLQQQ